MTRRELLAKSVGAAAVAVIGTGSSDVTANVVASRFNTYAVGRQRGWLSPNDVRKLEDRNPLPGDQGDLDGLGMLRVL